MNGAGGTPAYWSVPPPHERHHGLAIGLAILLGVIGVAIFLSILFHPTMIRPTPFGTFGWIWALFWLLVFFLFVSWMVRISVWGVWGGYYGGRHSGRHWRWDPAAQIVRERFARGEITREQYEQMMRDLSAHAP